MHAYKTDFITRNWERIKTARKPVIAAVAGFALGGGCEMAMMCDMIIASETAKFGQPEIKLGVAPGMGGSQRLTRAIGKAKAMDLCLTARMMDAAEAEKAGLVARVIPADALLEETLKAAQTIAGFSLPVVMMIKESVNRAFESSLNEGLLFERRVFHSAFALEDQKEGMAAALAVTIAPQTNVGRPISRPSADAASSATAVAPMPKATIAAPRVNAMPFSSLSTSP